MAKASIASAVLGPQPLEDYRRRLHELKRRYPLLEMPGLYWVERGVADSTFSSEDMAIPRI